MKARSFIGVLFGVAAIAAALLWPIKDAFAQELSFVRGEVLHHMLDVCIEKQDAVDIAKADHVGGLEAAQAVWLKKDKCGTVPVSGPTVGLVVFSAKTERGGKVVTVLVVEIIGKDKEVMGYFLTSAPMHSNKRT